MKIFKKFEVISGGLCLAAFIVLCLATRVLWVLLTDQIEPLKGFGLAFVLVFSFLLLWSASLGVAINGAIKDIRLSVKKAYRKNPKILEKGTDAAYGFIKGNMKREKRIALIVLITLLFADVLPPLRKIFLKTLQEESAPAQ